MINATNEGGKTFAPIAPGTYPARCYSMVHIGTVTEEYQGEKKEQNKVRITWELPTELKEFKEYIIKDKYTYSCFISPSGDGIKVLVKIPAEPENHLKYWEALKDYYNNDHFDLSTSDIPRVCFESYDEDIFINNNSELWNTINKIEEEIKSDEVIILPLKSSNQIIQKLQ